MPNLQSQSGDHKQEVISIIKEWASPVLIGIVSMLLWRDVTELRSDVKILLSQQSANEVRIQSMESDINMLKSVLFKNHEADYNEQSTTTTTNGRSSVQHLNR